MKWSEGLSICRSFDIHPPPKSNVHRTDRNLSRFVAATLLAIGIGYLGPSWAGAGSPPESVRCSLLRSVHDGDTLTCVSKDRGSFVVRFAGIDAPETGQAYWRVSRDRLRELAGPGTVADCYKKDQYGRQVCRLRSPNGDDLADKMIGEGLAWHASRFADEQTSEERTRYARLEAEARQAKRGLWADLDPMPPTECRRAKQERGKCR